MIELSEQERLRVKANIERALSEIFSDKYGCKITMRFVPREEAERLDAEEEAKNATKGGRKNVS